MLISFIKRHWKIYLIVKKVGLRTFSFIKEALFTFVIFLVSVFRKYNSQEWSFI